MKTLDKFVSARFASLLTNLDRYHRFGEPETLHRIRVDIKNIKSVLQLMDASLKKFDGHEQYLPLRNIFRKAAEIRHAEVMLHQLIGHALEGLPIDQLGDPKKLQEEFRSEVSFYLQQIERHGVEIRGQLKRLRKKHLLGYLGWQMKKIKSRFVPKMRAKELHTVRKSIKGVIYLSHFVDLVRKRKLKFYARLEEAIGNLHDQEGLLEFVKETSVQVDPAVIATLRKACARDRKAIAVLAREFYG